MTMINATDTVHIPANMVLVPYEEYERLLTAEKNDAYRKKLEQSLEQIKQGKVVAKTMEELEAMEDE
ncbi:MAG: hypothetical protein J5819_06125 [Eubacterium sp.]|nr:hypothetical protein [Eubacterium sp.]